MNLVCRNKPTKYVALASMMGLLVSCAVPGSQSDNDEGVKDTMQQESGDDTVIDWSEGLTQKEQLAEIEFVVSVMQDHFGDDIMRAGNWTLEGFADLKGNPRPSHRADDHYYYRVEFDFSEVEANQETQEKALAVLEELGLTPNGEQPTTYDEDRRIALYVAGGEDDYGRLFLVEQMNPGEGIKAVFSTRHSDHQSMYEAHEASWE